MLCIMKGINAPNIENARTAYDMSPIRTKHIPNSSEANIPYPEQSPSTPSIRLMELMMPTPETSVSTTATATGRR